MMVLAVLILALTSSAEPTIIPPKVDLSGEDIASCLKRFTPGTADGSPVTAKAAVPISLIREHPSSDIEIESAKLLTTSAEVEDAYRACYPQDSLAMQTANYKLTIGVDGIPRNIKLIESGGDVVLDQAGLCIIERLRFKPTLRGNKPVKSAIVLPLKLRPAR